MHPRYMLDTNAVISLRKNQPAITRRARALDADDAVMSVVTYGELRVGIEKSDRPAGALEVLERLVAVFPVRPMPVSVALDYGFIRAGLERRGEMIGPNDLWIAAHARAEDLTLITNNEREFRRVPDLRVENWAVEEA